jgi:hypothetical protein
MMTCPYCGEPFEEKDGRPSFYAVTVCASCRRWKETASKEQCEVRLLEQRFRTDQIHVHGSSAVVDAMAKAEGARHAPLTIRIRRSRMTIGTKSVLFGAHQFLIHPWFVAAGWWKLYGFPFDPRLWVAFFVHDLGYIGKPNMDGAEGEEHVFGGARIMGTLFDFRDRWCASWFALTVGRLLASIFGTRAPGDLTWYCFSFYHSRFMSKRYGVNVSPLCYADKMAIVLTPAWLYLPLTRRTGELEEYMRRSEQKEGAKYATMVNYASEDRQWYENMRAYIRRWVDEHKDGRADTWTPEAASNGRQ